MNTVDSALRGTAAIAAMFERTRLEGRSAFLPYFPIGFPGYQESLEAIMAMAETGVDGFEIGMPFSDPLADGPVNQAAMQIALENGTTVQTCLDAVKALRDRGVDQPMLLMGYLNPILAYGEEAFVKAVVNAGADGLIVPDLPPEEGALLSGLCQKYGLALVYFLAPTSTQERITLVAGQATGFIYVVSFTGVTGVRSELPDDLTEFISRLRRQVNGVPLVMGFGISKPEHARLVSSIMDGFIVGSALVRAGREGTDAVRELSLSLRQALN
ncbi:MAG: tryptophan synthase subunit alpha [Anaerolineae bacterium]|nr:tryptophan synthase subunit alpha [Anaerolineae bacterium]